jgi:acyl-CoA thioesterase YciA
MRDMDLDTVAYPPELYNLPQQEEGKELVLKVAPMPSDCNANGDIFGGWVVGQMDIAGWVLPARYAKSRVVTVAINQLVFKQPVRVGDLLSFFASISHIGRTSMTVDVDVYAERIEAPQKYRRVTEGRMTYVAVDEQGRPRPISRHQSLT